MDRPYILIGNAYPNRWTMCHSLRTGLSFGLTSGIITTLGLVVGLYTGTYSRLAVIGGVLTIAIADAMGIHISEESENVHTPREVWESTLFTFTFKFLFSSLLVPLVTLGLREAVLASVAWGMSLLAAFSYHMARGARAPGGWWGSAWSRPSRSRSPPTRRPGG